MREANIIISNKCTRLQKNIKHKYYFVWNLAMGVILGPSNSQAICRTTEDENCSKFSDVWECMSNIHTRCISGPR